MRRPTIATLPLLLAVLLPWFTAAAVAGQSDGVDGPGQAAPWSVEGSPNPPRRPNDGDLDRDDLWDRKNKAPRSLKCQILEVEELGRIYVQESSGGSPYWIQLPREVKIRTLHRDSFGGRKKLTIEDLEVGQRLVVILRRSDDEIVKVTVRPAKG